VYCILTTCHPFGTFKKTALERPTACFCDKIINLVCYIVSWMMWYSPQMKLLQAQFSFCQPLMLHTASASAKTQGAIASAVLIRKWHLVMLTLWKNKSKLIQAGRVRVVLSAFMAVEEALVFI